MTIQTALALLPKRGFTTNEAARYLGVSVSYLRKDRMHKKRDGFTPGPPWIRIGRRIKYLKEDLDAWLEQCSKEYS